MDFWNKMLPHLFAQDWYIGAWAILTAVLLFLTLRSCKELTEMLQSRGRLSELQKLRQRLNLCNSLFTTFISIFPLWGMFGTVSALLRLDLSGELSQVQGNFFEALTSTAWGILFAIGFKVLNASFVSYKAEELLEQSGRILERKPASGQVRK